ncbi:MAG TPA: hypothetical protein VJU15_03340, partial [Gemmatimonadales bacterium]|nr:hypothetical protein [Gemmatimonadales bacterium]
MRSLVILLCVLAGNAAAQSKHPPPPMPRYLEGYCEGESCGFDYKVVACKRLTLRNGDTGSARTAGSLVPGDSASVVTGSIRVTAPGVVIVRRDTLLATDDGYPRADTLRLESGDTVYVLEYHELGYWTLWYHGTLTEGIEFWNGPGQNYFGKGRDSLPAFSPTRPITET